MDSCENSCENGRVRSLTGCEICECIDPCKYLKCPDDEQCVTTGSTATCESSNLTFKFNLFRSGRY